MDAGEKLLQELERKNPSLLAEIQSSLIKRKREEGGGSGGDREDPSGKRFRMEDEADIRTLAASESPFAVKAHEALTVHFVEDDRLTPLFSFTPEFTHQLFESEVIIGYKDLCIGVFVHLSSLRIHFKISFSEKVDHIQFQDQILQADSVEDTLNEFLLTNDPLSSFTATPLPFTTKIYENESLVIFQSDLKSPAEEEYFRRCESLSLFLIESADRINTSDHRWQTFFVFTKQEHWLVGYVTLFHYQNPFRHATKHQIIRICQFLVLPRFQHQSTGKVLLERIFEYARENHVLEVSVENPSERFEKFRDRFDLAHLEKTPVFEAPLHTLSVAEVQQLTKEYPITTKQLVRVYEIDQYRRLESKDTKQYRLMLKERIYKENRDLIAELSDADKRKGWIHTLYRETIDLYDAIVRGAEPISQA